MRNAGRCLRGAVAGAIRGAVGLVLFFGALGVGGGLDVGGDARHEGGESGVFAGAEEGEGVLLYLGAPVGGVGGEGGGKGLVDAVSGFGLANP